MPLLDGMVMKGNESKASRLFSTNFMINDSWYASNRQKRRGGYFRYVRLELANKATEDLLS